MFDDHIGSSAEKVKSVYHHIRQGCPNLVDLVAGVILEGQSFIAYIQNILNQLSPEVVRVRKFNGKGIFHLQRKTGVPPVLNEIKEAGHRKCPNLGQGLGVFQECENIVSVSQAEMENNGDLSVESKIRIFELHRLCLDLDAVRGTQDTPEIGGIRDFVSQSFQTDIVYVSTKAFENLYDRIRILEALVFLA